MYSKCPNDKQLKKKQIDAEMMIIEDKGEKASANKNADNFEKGGINL